MLAGGAKGSELEREGKSQRLAAPEHRERAWTAGTGFYTMRWSHTQTEKCSDQPFSQAWWAAAALHTREGVVLGLSQAGCRMENCIGLHYC